ncbi:SLAP domain-containing protein [Lactobacillus sp. B4026]|uniref:SLAP domain-containing protein n=1 Tax=Lactobacillus sp. B4026 TaxID=2818035 RepID=UPI00226B2723|nr:SLAP domain-containing protein [Lactobacillus sp. B4026]MCX8736505.1 SLAP domain-containing protein [Lactobacillus sp. B4026]
MINKKSITKISSGLLIGLGLVTLQQNPSSVSAASSPRVQLRHNFYVYSSTGKRKGKASLKRGTYLKTFGKRSIKGKTFYKIGKGRYIKKVNTVIPPKEDKDPVLFTVYLKDDAEFYTKPNGKPSLYTLMGKQNVYQTYNDNNGNTWYRIKYQNWVKSSDTQKSKVKEDKEVPTSANWDDPNDNTSIEVDNTSISSEKQMKSNLPSGTALDRNTIEETARCFEKLVNDWRANQGIATKVTYVTSRYDYDVSRAVQDAQHYDKYKVSDKHAGAKGTNYGELETLVINNNPQKMAQEAFQQLVYKDASSNFAHRDILKQASLKTIGIGLATTNYNGYVSNGVTFIVSTSSHFN